MGRTVLQLTPLLPPSLDGIADHATLLARRLREQAGLGTRFVAVQPMTVALPEVDGFEARYLQGDGPARLLPTLAGLSGGRGDGSDLIVHYAPSSYHRLNTPVWLLTALRRWKEPDPSRRVILVLHEFLSKRPSRRLEIPLRPAQILLSRRLLELASLTVCSNTVVEAQAHRLVPSARLVRAPVYSNFLEPELSPAELGQRDPGRWIVLGLVGRLRRTLLQLLDDLPLLSGWASPTRLLVAGGEEDPTVRELARRLGRQIPEVDYRPALSVDEISAELRVSAFCYQRIFPDTEPWHRPMVFKSGVFAAANAHGVVSVFGDRLAPHASWERGHPGIVSAVAGEPGFSFPEAASLPSFRARLHRWYSETSSSARFASTILGVLDESDGYLGTPSPRVQAVTG